MHLAYVMSDQRGAGDACLAEVSARLAARGIRLAGGVQCAIDRADRDFCDLELSLLPDGPKVKISQDLGPMAQECRLDADALEGAVQRVAARLAAADLLMVNKFGKQEQIGRGFVPLIARALEAGMPVILGVRAENLASFQAFAGDLAQSLSCDCDRVEAWALAALARRAA